MNKKITFVLPGSSGEPTGGSRIVYEYANRLSQRGHYISVVHAPITRVDAGWKEVSKALIRYPQRIIDKSYRPDSWFNVSSAVDIYWVPTLHHRFIPDADIVIATAWKTAEWVADYPEDKGIKFYFIQGYEDWDGSVDRVEATWRLPLNKIVISRWLKKHAEKTQEPAIYVPNAIDHEKFCVQADPAERVPYSVAMLFHKHPSKGAREGLRALGTLKERIPELEIELFGVPSRPKDLPDYIEYKEKPKQSELRMLYNRAALFLAPSFSEGWGLTALEAMACGAAIVATDNSGHREFAIHNRNSLLVRPGDWRAMANSLEKLVREDATRMRLANNGIKCSKRFVWDKSVEELENTLLNHSKS